MHPMLIPTNKQTLRKMFTLVTFCCVSVVLYAFVQHQARVRAVNQQIAQQILLKSEPLCRLLVPERESRSVVTELTGRGDGNDFTSVTCNNTAGDEIANMTWDRHTGALMQVGNSVVERVAPKCPSLSRWGALHCAWRWLVRMGLVAQDAHLQITSPPQCVHRAVWNISYNGHIMGSEEREYIYMKLDAHTGMLLEMHLNDGPMGIRPVHKK